MKPRSNALAWTQRFHKLQDLRARLVKRRIVTLHHLACSGGTLFTKCLAAMPGTAVLSEIHPDRTAQPAFHPLCQLRRGYGSRLEARHASLFYAHFRREIELAHDIAKDVGLSLIVRDHAHVDFATKQQNRSLLIEQLGKVFEIIPITTVRHPMSVWPSLLSKGWFDGDPDQLCRAQLALLEGIPGASVFRYEDLVSMPEAVVKEMCSLAGINFVPDFEGRLKDVTHLTGDSGRSGTNIAPRTPRPLPDDVVERFFASPAFERLCRIMGYGKSPAEIVTPNTSQFAIVLNGN